MRLYGNKADIYSFGVTLLHFIIGKHPFSNDNGQINILRMATGRPIDAALKHPHPHAKLALRMIELDPNARPSAADILQYLLSNTSLQQQPLPQELQKKKKEKKKHRCDQLQQTSTSKRVSADTLLKEAFALVKKDLERSEIPSKKEWEERRQTHPGLWEDGDPVLPFPSVALSGVSYSGSRILFTGNVDRTVGIGGSLFIGRIYHLDLLMVTGNIAPGVAEMKAFPSLFSNHLWSRKDTAAMFANVLRLIAPVLGGPIPSTSAGVGGEGDSWTPGTHVSLELDQSAHTLHFFVNGNQLPFRTVHIPNAVYFAVSVDSSSAGVVEVCSLKQIDSTTINPFMDCEECVWG